MNITVTLEQVNGDKFLPEDALKKISDVLFVDKLYSPGREEQLELYCKMLLNNLTMAEASVIDLHKRASQYRKMFQLWAPHVKALRRKP